METPPAISNWSQPWPAKWPSDQCSGELYRSVRALTWCQIHLEPNPAVLGGRPSHLPRSELQRVFYTARVKPVQQLDKQPTSVADGNGLS